MKPSNTKTLWKRKTTAAGVQTEFDRVIHSLTAYANAAPTGNLDEVLSALQKNDIDRTSKTKELLTAVENVLENVKLDLVKSQSGVTQVLRDVAAFFLEARTITALERETTRLDELLERLDFVASGGTDEEVPRAQLANATARRLAFVPKLPLERPQKFEDPTLTHHVERLMSLNSVLQVHTEVPSESSEKNHLLLEQLSLANSVLHNAKQELTMELTAFASSLVQEVRESLEKKATKSVDIVQIDTTDGVMYRSLAEEFHRKLRDAVVIIGKELLLHPDAEVHIKFRVRNASITSAITFVGLSTAFDLIKQRLEELSLAVWDSPIQNLKADKEEALRKTTKTRKERIANGLVELQQFVYAARGHFAVTSSGEDRLLVSVELPIHTRILHTLPIVVGSDRFLLESHFLTAVLDSTKVRWNDQHTNIEFEDKSYQYCLIADHIQPTTSDTDAPTWMLLLDTPSRKLALEVETFEEPELKISPPSISELNHGHKFLGENTLKLLLDPMELKPKGSTKSNVRHTKETETPILCFNVSPSLVDKIRRCITTDRLSVRHTTTMADALTELQEFQPAYLIIEDHLDEFRAVDAVGRIAHTLPSLNLQILLFAEAGTTTTTLMDHVSFNVTCLDRGVDFGELRKVFVAGQDFAKSAVESTPD